MTVTAKWDNEEQTVLRYVYEGQWTWDEAWEAMAEAAAMTTTVPHIVDAIIDMSASKGMPIGAITQLRTSRKLKPSNRGLFIIISNSTLFNTLPKIVQTLFPKAVSDYRVAKSEEEAALILEKVNQERQSQKE
jgi:hypothetical protein